MALLPLLVHSPVSNTPLVVMVIGPRDLCREASKGRFNLSSQEKKKPGPPSFLSSHTPLFFFITKRKFAQPLMEANLSAIFVHDVIATHDARCNESDPHPPTVTGVSANSTRWGADVNGGGRHSDSGHAVLIHSGNPDWIHPGSRLAIAFITC